MCQARTKSFRQEYNNDISRLLIIIASSSIEDIGQKATTTQNRTKLNNHSKLQKSCVDEDSQVMMNMMNLIDINMM
jgi:hypothetical protein